MNSDYTTLPATLTPCPLAEGLHLAQLPNGLRVIIKEDHRSPVAICNVWVKVGSNREPERLRGWSHGIEHIFCGGNGLDSGLYWDDTHQFAKAMTKAAQVGTSPRYKPDIQFPYSRITKKSTTVS